MLGRMDGGKYRCTADNGVGHPVSRDVQLNVLCKYMCACKRDSERHREGQRKTGRDRETVFKHVSIFCM